MNKKIKWKLLVSRETTLFERYLRVCGYGEMFGKNSKMIVKNILVINHNGVTDQYIDPVDADKRRIIAYQEYYKTKLRALIPLWHKTLRGFNNSLRMMLRRRSLEYFDEFIVDYRLARAIVFYTEALGRALSNSKSKREIDFVQKWHERAEIASCKAWDKFCLLLKSLVKKYDVKFSDVLFYTPLEFKKLIDRSKKISVEVIDQRQRYYLLILKNKKISLYIGKRAKELERSLLKHLQFNIKSTSLRGIPAYPGKVQGRVRVVNTVSDMRQMRRGEILVSTMTTPRLMSAATKARAIVTNEGGIICHAAVISREFKIPCVVGTKFATKILHNGDLIEVNATKGIIKYLRN